MSEQLIISGGEKNDKYQTLLRQLPALIDEQVDNVANMSNLVAALKQTFGFFWVGFYRVKADELVLGPFQGPIACTRIKKGQGVCGASWLEERTIVVPNVHEFPGHIACSNQSKSEIVVPLFKAGVLVAVLDVDSDEFATFDEDDKIHLEKILEWFSAYY
ncbi:MAG: GAF domain-containing protein [Flavobacteriales bacterium]|jgi:L-methionine (R)-S-oxide reductase